MKKQSLFLISLLSSFAYSEDFIIDMRNKGEHLKISDLEKKINKDVIDKTISNLNTKRISEHKINNSNNSIIKHNFKQIVYTENQMLSNILKKIGKFHNYTYILNGEDILIKKGYKVSNIEELQEVIKLVSSYELKIKETKLKNTSILELVQNNSNKRITLEAKVDFDSLKELLLDEFNLKLILPKEINKNVNFYLFGSYTVEELINDLQKQSNIWFIKEKNTLVAQKYKDIVFDIKKDGKFNINFSNKKSTISNGFSFKLDDNSKNSFIKDLKNNFPKIKFKSSNSGFIVSTVSPNQFKSITEYFKNINERFELITGEIILLSFQKNNNDNFNVSWENLLLGQNLLKFGDNGTLFLNNLNIGTKQDNTNTLSIGSKNGTVGFIQALSDIGNVSIVDKWIISTATGIPTGFTNYKKTPYFTKELSAISPSITSLDGALEKTNVQYVLTGFKSTFNVNKTTHDSYIIDGAIDYSNIDGYKQDEKGLEVPIISGKTMRIYTEFDELDKTIVIGGFKNLNKSDSKQEVPFLSKIPLIGWLFSSNNNIDTKTEFIILIKLKKPTQLKDKEQYDKYKILKKLKEPVKPIFEDDNTNKKQNKQRVFNEFI